MNQTSIVEGSHKTCPNTERRWQYKGWYSAKTRDKMPGQKADEYREQSQPATIGVFGESTDKVWVHNFMFSLPGPLPEGSGGQVRAIKTPRRKFAGRGIKRQQHIVRTKIPKTRIVFGDLCRIRLA